jgi:glycerol uptake facilitator-like aquaporin
MMTHTWTRRLIEVVWAFALVAEIWRFFTTRNAAQDSIADVVEFVGLVIIGLACLYVEVRSSRLVKRG